MTTLRPTDVPGDKLKKAIACFCELLESEPSLSRKALLHKVEVQFDLSPRECEFLNAHFAKDQAPSTE